MMAVSVATVEIAMLKKAVVFSFSASYSFIFGSVSHDIASLEKNKTINCIEAILADKFTNCADAKIFNC